MTCQMSSSLDRTAHLARHARPFVGAFQSQFAIGLSTFDDNSQQTGSKSGAGITPRRALCGAERLMT